MGEPYPWSNYSGKQIRHFGVKFAIYGSKFVLIGPQMGPKGGQQLTFSILQSGLSALGAKRKKECHVTALQFGKSNFG